MYQEEKVLSIAVLPRGGHMTGSKPDECGFLSSFLHSLLAAPLLFSSLIFMHLSSVICNRDFMVFSVATCRYF